MLDSHTHEADYRNNYYCRGKYGKGPFIKCKPPIKAENPGAVGILQPSFTEFSGRLLEGEQDRQKHQSKEQFGQNADAGVDPKDTRPHNA